MYRGGPGMWSFYLHRLTGVGLFLFLLLHIADTSLVTWGPSLYNRVTAVYGTPPFRLVELMLVGAVVYHGLNGVRLIMVDSWPLAARHQGQLAYAVVLLSVLAILPAAYVVLRPVLVAMR